MNNNIPYRKNKFALLCCFALLSIISFSSYADDNQKEEDKKKEKEKEKQEVMVVSASSAEDMLKQQLGVSTITSEDIEKNPPVNDLSDIIRTQPGVNLTGNSASGSRGNNRQIDIRGMGPENTLILIDGKPVTSRNAVRYSWSGERDTRGDSNWVPAEMVERIEVIRGPAAARYGSGAAGGVVNIITKKPTDDWVSSLSLYAAIPQHSKYGDTQRLGLSTSGELIKDVLSMRLYGNLNSTDADAYGINPSTNVAGREGVNNKDVNGSLRWTMSDNQYLTFDTGYSRQGNIYTGDSQTNTTNTSVISNIQTLAKIKAETNKMYRQNYSLGYDGYWDFGETKFTMQYDRTNNTRLKEGLTGGVEGAINDISFNTSRLKNYYINGETIIPIEKWLTQTLTMGTEYTYSYLNDPASTAQADSLGLVDSSVDRANSHMYIASLYVEDAIEPFVGANIIPGLRFDYLGDYGANYSPSLNFSQQLGSYFSLKAGIAKAFKAPNLYQSNPGYLLLTRGNGCPTTITTKQTCYLLGNADLDPEISINKELGLEFKHEDWQASVTYFRNDYSNKIIAGTTILNDSDTDGYYVTKWENSGPAVVEGLEGNLRIPLLDSLSWSTNMTYMLQSVDKTTGNPLSIIPKYTINSTLDWTVTDDLSTFFRYTQYGKQTPRKYATNWLDSQKPISTLQVAPYALFGIGTNYKINKDWRVNVGIDNLLDTQIYRQGKGASTYNEAGRFYYIATTYAF